MTWTQIIPGVFQGLPGEDHMAEEAELRVRMSNIPPQTLQTHRLETWQHKPNEPWWSKVKQYADGQYEHPFVTLLGLVGTGKTHIALSIGWSWLRNGSAVLYYQVEDLLDALRRGYSSWQGGDPDGYNTIIQFARNVGLLILDDLGAHNETEWATSKLDQIVDYRYIHKKPLVATTNLALNRLPARIGDRLSEGLLVQLTGESFRKQKKASRKK
jgi:DNA replication protein DnaC